MKIEDMLPRFSHILSLLVLLKKSKFSNVINITTFYLLNILNISWRLSKMKSESLKLRQKLSYLGIVHLAFEKKCLLSHYKQPRIFQNANFYANLKTLKFGTKIPLFGYFFFGWNLKLRKSYLKLSFSNWKILRENKNA